MYIAKSVVVATILLLALAYRISRAKPAAYERFVGGFIDGLNRVVVVPIALYGSFLVVQFLWSERWVELSSPLWHVEDGKTVVLDAITLENTTSFELKDFTVGCDAIGNSGTVIETPKATIYETLAKYETKQFFALPLGKYPDQAARISCRVLDVRHVW